MQIAHLKPLSVDEILTAVSNIIARFLHDPGFFFSGQEHEAMLSRPSISISQLMQAQRYHLM